jgi:restriction system protein
MREKSVARKSDNSLFEDLLELSMRLKWWKSLIIAAIVYLVLHAYASHTEPPPTDMAAFGSYAGHQLWHSLALFMQYILSVPFVLGALFSAIKGRQMEKKYARTAALGTSAGLLQMSWQEFEELVGEYYRRQGYSVSRVGGSGPDGGVDLELTKGTERYLVQCKQWRATKVGVKIVRELYGVMASRGSAGAFVVSAGTFTDDARDFSRGTNIVLVDGNTLISSMRTTAAKSSAATRTIEAGTTPPVECPKCGSPMVKRVATRGPKAGDSFWGCSNYPRCNGIRSV